MTNEISELFLEQENHKQDEVMHCYFSGKLHKNKHVTGELTLTNPAPFQTQPILNYPNMIGNGRVEGHFSKFNFSEKYDCTFLPIVL
jgi:hypothetical protein